MKISPAHYKKHTFIHQSNSTRVAFLLSVNGLNMFRDVETKPAQIHFTCLELKKKEKSFP